MQLLYPYAHRCTFHFRPSPRDFTVEEIPLYPFSGEGEHTIIKVRKKGLSTWELLDIFSASFGIKRREIGYAGLKDKHAMTIQHLSLPSTYEKELERFTHEKVKILEVTRHRNKIRIGHLKGNRFFLRLKKVAPAQRTIIDSVLKRIETEGMPNYFGVQRFGVKGDNWQEGKRIVDGELKLRDRKLREFLIGAYQSSLFNAWLSKRIEMSLLAQGLGEREAEKAFALPQGVLGDRKDAAHFLRLLHGELMMHYPYGKLFVADDIREVTRRFQDRDAVPTGPLPGKKMPEAQNVAKTLEQPFYDAKIPVRGTRRYAWVFPDAIEGHYVEEEAHYHLRFNLPKGSYATVLVDLLAGR